MLKYSSHMQGWNCKKEMWICGLNKVYTIWDIVQMFVFNAWAHMQVGHQIDLFETETLTYINIRNAHCGECVGSYMFLLYLATSSLGERTRWYYSLLYFEGDCNTNFGQNLMYCSFKMKSAKK